MFSVADAWKRTTEWTIKRTLRGRSASITSHHCLTIALSHPSFHLSADYVLLTLLAWCLFCVWQRIVLSRSCYSSMGWHWTPRRSLYIQMLVRKHEWSLVQPCLERGGKQHANLYREIRTSSLHSWCFLWCQHWQSFTLSFLSASCLICT